MAKLKKLVIVRHGDYDWSLHLSEKGREQMQRMAAKLQTLANGTKPLLLSSVAPRATQSAEILAGALGVDFEQQEVLWSEGAHPQDLLAAYDLLRPQAESQEIIVLVTHLEYAEDFAEYFIRKYFGKDVYQRFKVKKGEAVLVDCEKLEIIHLKPA